jgi:hypothetical protein
VRDGTLEQILEALARDLKERGKLDLSECFIAKLWQLPALGGALEGYAPNFPGFVHLGCILILPKQGV